MYNPSRRGSVTSEQARRIANREAFLEKFNPVHNQVMLRFSSAQSGLRNGSPPPRFVEWEA